MTSSLTRRPSEPETKHTLTINKVVAGAGAAATSAVAGSFFGAPGTIVGAAAGSIVSMVAATLYERSLDRTRESVHARVRRLWRGGADTEATRLLRAMPPAAGRPRARYARPQAPGRRWLIPVAGSVLVFVLGLLAVTGLELVKGSQLASADEGTSVGRVVSPGESATEDPRSAPEATTSPTSTTPKTSASAVPTKTTAPTDDETPGRRTTSGGSPDEGRDEVRTAATATPRPADVAATRDVAESGG